ncbi:DeoR/GlpR family DNA-binding transcription regulator [Microbacterium betulae]|uniref:DeoR/GlpR family DNA-binding transcription regulator n=1 Tax=Microbacterium betulae TaxID=2981139 RepID=A0AA97FLI9_9MICO|nr:DeoR/GlpR family DNA-binding transcription regulator [Microbacterium sp. AB]WOF24264.1 DeoR/GlpR family DNA-binding transcription regulator [Microbacterium sp. AB]
MAISNLDAERRRERLVALAHEADGVLIDAAAELFAVSTMTIRRDLLDLEAEGRVRRVRGGAVAAETARAFDARSAVRATAKRAVAAKALSLVPRRGVVALDASTTVHALAASLGSRDRLMVCTNAFETFQAANRLEGVTAVLSGGAAEPTTGSLVGPIARRSLSSVYFDVFFASADAVDPSDGTSEVSVEEAEVKRMLAAGASRTVLCVDASKLGRRSVARALESDEISAIVTELEPSDPRLDPYRSLAEII